MTSAVQLASERFPDTTLPSVLPLPAPPLTPDDCVRYLRLLHVVLNMNQTRLAEIMRIVSYHRSTVSTDEDTGLGGEPTGGLDEMPAATGSGVEHAYVDRVTGRARLFVDTLDSLGAPYWFEVIQNAEDVPTDTTDFDDELSAADDTVQKALDTLDDHDHDDEYISIIAAPAANHFPYQTADGELIDSTYDAADFAAAVHNHDADYISVIAAPAANHFPYQTVGGELVDSTYDAADFAAAVHAHSDYLPKSAGSAEALTGDLYINDAHDILLNTTGVSGTYRAALSAAGTQITLGNATDNLVFAGNKLYFHDEVEFDGAHSYTFMSGARLSFAEGSMMYMEDVGAGFFSQFMSNGGGDVTFGNTQFTLLLSGDPVYWGDGGVTNYSEMETDGDLIQYGSAKIENESSVLTPALYCSNLAATRVKTMLNNTAQNFFKWGTGAAAGDSMHFIVHFSIQVQYTLMGTTYYWTRGGSISGTILKLAAALVKAIPAAVVWDGAAIAFSAAGASNAPAMGETVGMGVSVAAADHGPYFYVNLTGLGYAFVSGECRFTIIHTDTDHIALTGGF